jgi:hypothetical protein
MNGFIGATDSTDKKSEAENAAQKTKDRQRGGLLESNY